MVPTSQRIVFFVRSSAPKNKPKARTILWRCGDYYIANSGLDALHYCHFCEVEGSEEPAKSKDELMEVLLLQSKSGFRV